MNWFASLLAYASLTTLALAMNAHYKTVLKRDLAPARRWTLRFAGWSLLALSFAATIAALGWEMGTVSWLLSLACCGFALTLLLSYAPRFCALPLAGLMLCSLILS